MNKYSELIEELIELKDELKEIGFNWQKYQCINDACNALEEEGAKKDD